MKLKWSCLPKWLARRNSTRIFRIFKNIVISGLPECTSSEVKERIESDLAAVNKLVEMLDVDKSKVKKIRRLRATRKGEQTSARPGVVIVEFESSEDQVMALSNIKHLKK